MLDNIRLGVKLISGFLLVAVIALIVGGAGYYGISSLSGGMQLIGKTRISDLQTLATLNRQRMAIRAQTLAVFQYETQDNSAGGYQKIMADRKKSWEAVDLAWKKLLEVPRKSQKGKDLMSKVQGEYQAWRDIYKKLDAIIERFAGVSDVEAKKSLYAEYRNVVAEMVPLSDAMGKTFDELTENNANNTSKMV